VSQFFSRLLSPVSHLSALDLKTISKFAQLEYKYGDPERGKTIFEGIVDSHPKRWDLWSIYMDMESGQSDIQTLRCPMVSPHDSRDSLRPLTTEICLIGSSL
jgi:hypothetical protein